MPDPQLIFENMYSLLQENIDISREWSVAEFGIGKKGFGSYYARHFDRVLGIDIVDYSQYHQNVEFFISDGYTTRIPNASVDLVVSHSVLEHVGDLDAALSEINRITKVGGYFHLSVNPLYYSSYGSHVNIDGVRLDNWEHLDRASSYFLTRNPMPGSKTGGHDLNMLTSSKFLAAVGKQAWDIISYKLGFEKKPVPSYVERSVASPLDITLRSFHFFGQKLRDCK